MPVENLRNANATPKEYWVCSPSGVIKSIPVTSNVNGGVVRTTTHPNTGVRVPMLSDQARLQGWLLISEELGPQMEKFEQHVAAMAKMAARKMPVDEMPVLDASILSPRLRARLSPPAMQTFRIADPQPAQQPKAPK